VGKRELSIAATVVALLSGCGDDGGGDGVFFLAGTYGGNAVRRCSVPANRRVFLPVVNLMCGAPPGETARVQDECGADVRGARRRVELDGEPLKDVYLESPPFDFRPHPGAVNGGNDGRAVAVGWHVDLDRLAPGRHSLRWTASTEDGFGVDVRYELTVR